LAVLKNNPNIKQQDLIALVRPNVQAGEKKIRTVLNKLVALEIVLVDQRKKKNAKLYSINLANIEPGFWDGLESLKN